MLTDEMVGGSYKFSDLLKQQKRTVGSVSPPGIQHKHNSGNK